MRTLPAVGILAMILVARTGLAAAQAASDGTQVVPGGSGRNCMLELRAFGQAMNQDGYWLSGWQPARGAANGAPAGPWGAVHWPASPDGQLRTLYAAADLLAERGKEQTCQAVLDQARTLYASSVSDLRQQGVQTSKVRDYRREQIAAAVPVDRMGTPCRLTRIIGTDVRSKTDEYLGSVEDIVVASSMGTPSYALIGTGGFLGIGQEYVAVPWVTLEATPGFGMMVLGVNQDTLVKAPKVDPSQFVGNAGSRQQQEVDAYWKQHGLQ